MCTKLDIIIQHKTEVHGILGAVTLSPAMLDPLLGVQHHDRVATGRVANISFF